ncbi:hypothetical protein GB928_028115 [Shinella curvata]|uniref:Uncharacterized protein n=1 Tax=Shinella curvata TaxID=1817964 RepID=A0ABT8XMS8_9HYPH|nr:hypothetical protein [Shinella curvata]MCJ8057274.1 hypothetical protein [Shinella curvata]MDO6125054.1 hypothetical protein [Shinella curvata]
MTARFQVIALSSIDPDGTDTRDEPKLLYPDALTAAQQLRAQGKAFRIIADGEEASEYIEAFRDLGALVD